MNLLGVTEPTVQPGKIIRSSLLVRLTIRPAFFLCLMYENGNKIRSMGGGTFVDGEGDINKMVGTM